MALPTINPPTETTKAYKYHRINVFNDAGGSTTGYVALNTFSLFETPDSTTDMALSSNGAIATAQSTLDGYPASNAVDGATNYMIIHHGQPGFKPQVDGPVTPYVIP